MRIRNAALAALAGALLCTANGQAAVPTTTLLDALRKATFGRPLSSIPAIHTQGTIDAVGIGATYQEWDDLRSGRFATRQEGGALTGSAGWDGKVSWSTDYSGLLTIDGGMSGRLATIDQAYLDTFGYLRPNAGGAIVVYAGKRTDGGKTYDVLAVTPPYGSEIDLYIDPQTHLIAKETMTIGILSTTTLLSGYRRIDGITFPTENRSTSSQGNSAAIHIASLQVDGDVAGRLRVPDNGVNDASIAGADSTVPIDVINNHIYVNVMVDGHGPYRFIIDSGGDYIVTPQVAAAMHAKSAGGVQIGGVGSGTEGAAFAKLDTLSVGGATVRDQYTLVLPIASSFGVSEGVAIDGMLGYQFLARFITTIDYDGGKLTLRMPNAPPPADPANAAVPFFIDGTIPRVALGVNGVTTSAEVDTGNRAALELSTPFLAAHPTIGAFAKTAPGVVGFGVGGPAYARLGRVPNVQIGPYALSNVVTSFTDQKTGAFSDPFNPANIGSAFLRRFVVTFDYTRSQLLLAKAPDFTMPFNYDRSGLFLVDTHDAYTVISAFPNSPAASAGLAKGDVILTVDGKPANTIPLATLRATLSGNPGTVIHLHIKNATGEHDISLTLADYV